MCQLNIAYGVACGMSYLSGIGFVHRVCYTMNKQMADHMTYNQSDLFYKKLVMLLYNISVHKATHIYYSVQLQK